MDENKMEVLPKERKVIRVSKRKIKISLIIVIIIVVLFLLGSVILGSLNSARSKSFMVNEILPTMNESGSSKPYDSMRYKDYNNQVSISDTREFLKTNYSATIETRDVNKVVRFVENAIKGADGRVDSISTNEKYGSIKFVVAKSKFEDFRKEVEELTHEKLYTENVSSENLLTQKQGIEEQQGNIVNSLENWTMQRDSLVAKHNQTVSSINKEITRIGKELVSVRASMKTETDNIILASLVNQESYLIEQEKAQKKNLSSENSSYAIQKQNLDNLINNENSNLTNINKVDSQFMDNVETVNCYINVRWINLWEMAKIFSPIHPTLIIVIIIILAWILLRKKSFVPKVVLE